MAPPKKGSPFMSFVMEWKAKQKGKCTIDRAVEQAGAIWKTMSDQERSRYKNKAKQFAPMDAPKMTCTGELVSSVQKQAEEKEERDRRIKRHIEQIVSDSQRNNKLDSQSYYFIMCNYFTKLYNRNTYIPAEISVAEFSLLEGVTKKYHTYVNPEMDFFGQNFEAQQHTNNTHKLPLPPKAMGESDCVHIYTSILRFIYDEEKKQYPPVFTMRDNIPMVESVLDFLKTDLDRDIEIPVYPLQYLFFILKEATAEVGEGEKPASSYITDRILEQDFFDFTPDIACKYHEDIDRGNFCTQSYVTRWAYMFADHMCSDLAITMKPVRHMPRKAKLPVAAPVSVMDTEDTESLLSVRSTAMSTAMSTATSGMASGVKSGWASSVTSGVRGDNDYYNDFPDVSLASGRRTAKSTKAANNSFIAMPDVDGKSANPRAIRDGQHMPRMPDEASFAVGNPRTQPSWADDYDDDTASVSTVGPGRNVLPNLGAGRGMGRGATGRGWRLPEY